MNQEEKQLLENLFDSLDRLFDRECRAIDVYALLYSTEIAIRDCSLVSLAEYSKKTKKVVASGLSDELQRERTLEITSGLRLLLNDLLPIA